MKDVASSTSMVSTATSRCWRRPSSAARSTASARVDLTPLRAARARVAELDAELATFGGDARARAREMDLLRYQVDELDAAAIDDPDEDRALEAEEDRLADATAHREAAAVAVEVLAGDAGALDAIGAPAPALVGRSPFGDLEQRLRAVEAELADIGSELRQSAEVIADDPERLADGAGPSAPPARADPEVRRDAR